MFSIKSKLDFYQWNLWSYCYQWKKFNRSFTTIEKIHFFGCQHYLRRKFLIFCLRISNHHLSDEKMMDLGFRITISSFKTIKRICPCHWNIKWWCHTFVKKTNKMNKNAETLIEISGLYFFHSRRHNIVIFYVSVKTIK